MADVARAAVERPIAPQVDFGSPHGAELAFRFGSQGWPEVYGTDRVPRALTEQLMDAWLAFAKTGDPSHGNMPDWPAYDTTERSTMIFDTTDTSLTTGVSSDPAAEERTFWDGVPFDGITPRSKPEDP